LHYHDVIKYKKCAEDFPKLKTVFSELKLYIDYMDKVVDAILDICIEAEEEGTLNPEWRCKPLDEWLSIKYVMKCHSDDAISKWCLAGDVALLHLDPLEYGE
jgi:hypothetical protein